MQAEGWEIPSLRPRVPQIALWREVTDCEGWTLWCSTFWSAVKKLKNPDPLENQEKNAKNKQDKVEKSSIFPLHPQVLKETSYKTLDSPRTPRCSV